LLTAAKKAFPPQLSGLHLLRTGITERLTVSLATYAAGREN
jgi:hypothetical protein